MHAISGFSKLSKTIRQTSSNIPRQTHTPMAKASPIPSKSNARVQSQKLIESSNQTSSNILKQQSSYTCTYSQYQFGFVLDSIRYNRAIGIPFTILSTALNKRKQTRVQRYRIEFSRSHVSLDRRRRRRADNCRCLDNKSVSIINRR